MKLQKFITFKAIVLVSIPLTEADIVVKTGFETFDSPSYPAAVAELELFTFAPQLPIYSRNAVGTKNILSANSPFGKGQYLEIGGPNMRVMTPTGLTALTTIAFDLYEPSGIGGGMSFGFGTTELNSSNGYLIFRLNDGSLGLGSNTERVSGTFPSLEVDRHYTMRILSNRTAAQQIVTLPNADTITLEAGEATMLIKDMVTKTLLQAGVFKHTASVTPNTFIFRNFSSDNNIINIDNFTRYNTLEPIEDPTWEGGAADNLWSSALNWFDEVPPVAGDGLIFSGTTNTVTQNDLADGTSIQSIVFDESAGNFTLSGNSIVLAGNIENRVLESVQTLDFDLALNNTRTFTSPNTGEIIAGGLISGNGGIIKAGSGILSLTNDNSYTGRTTVTGGTVNVSGDHSAANGSWSLTPSSATEETRVNLLSGSMLSATSGGFLRISSVIASDTARQTFSVAGTVTSSVSLRFGRTGRLEIGSGGNWSQSSDISMVGNSGFGPSIEIVDGGVFRYSGNPPIAMTSGNVESGRTSITITESVFETTNGFSSTSTDIRPMVTVNEGVLRLNADVPVLSNNVDFVLAGAASIDTNGFDATLTTPLSGDLGSLVKSGEGIITLVAAPTYKGDTTIEAGVLALNAPGLADESAVEIKAGAQMQLDFTGQDIVASVKLGDTLYTSGGTFSSVNHPAFFTGTGTLVIEGGGAGFAAWAAGFELSGNPQDDFDNDGIPDSVEYALAGLDPKVPDPAAGSYDGVTLTYTKRAEAVTNGDVTYVIEASTDLGATSAWTPLTTTVNDDNIISAELPTGLPANFARLRVIIAAP